MTVMATYPVAPAVTPPVGGLLSVATVSDQFTWLDGTALFDSYNCMTFGAEAAFCADNEKDFDNSATWQDGARFAAYGGTICKAIGLDQSRMLSETERVYLAGESTAVERGLMKYRFAESTGHWDAPTDITPAGGAVCPAAGIALLEGWARGHYVGTPTLHVPTTIASLMLVGNSIVPDGAESGLMTKLGSDVVVGAGYEYPNLGPDGEEAADGERWVYATGEVLVIRGPMISRQAFNQSTNEVTVLAERPYIVAVDCFAAAIRVLVEC